MFLYLGLAMVGGFLLANQNPINADLRKTFGSPFLTSAFSNLMGSIFLGLITVVTTKALFPSWTFVIQQPAWIWLGGLLGGIFLTSNVLLFPRLGAVQTVILPILGQIIMGTLIDTCGWFGAMQLSIGGTRITGILITLIGVLVAVVLPNLKEKSQNQKQKGLILWRLWAIFVGALSAMQQAINGHLGVLLGNSAQAAFLSFLIGLLAILFVSLFADKRVPNLSDFKKMKPWNYIGGILGGTFVLATVLAVPQIGAGLTIMMGLLGQILGSMLVQQFGWWRSERYQIQVWQVVGIATMLVGIVIIKFL